MLNLTISSESQWKDVSDILSVRKYCQLFTHESNKFVTNNAIETNGGKTPQNLLKPPFNLQHVDSHLIHQCLVRPHPLSQMKAQSVHALQHNYATKSLLVTMGCPKFTSKIVSFGGEFGASQFGGEFGASHCNHPYCRCSLIHTSKKCIRLVLLLCKMNTYMYILC